MARSITFEARTDVGRERRENQDFYGSLRQENVEFFIVCDGMGGHAGGSTASRLAVETIVDSLEKLDLPAAARMEEAVKEANRAIFTMSMERRELRGMGTTAVIMAVDHDSNTAHLVHVGDSRIYRLRGNVFQRMTRDHTMVQRLVDEGIITEEEAENHPNSNVISRSLGGQGDVEVEHAPEAYTLEEGDIFLLCTDGLSGLVSEREMAYTLSTLPPADAAERLIDRANEEGGHDNITVEVVLIGTQPEPFTDPLELVHPPRGPSARERWEQTYASGSHGVGKTGETVALELEPPPFVIPADSTSNADDANGGKEIIVEEPGIRLWIMILGVLSLILLVLVLFAIIHLLDKKEDPVLTIPATPPTLVYDEEMPVFVDEDPEPIPAYEVPFDEMTAPDAQVPSGEAAPNP